MPFSNDCIDKISDCPNRYWSLTVGQKTNGESVIQVIDPLSGETVDLTKYDIPPGSSSSSSSSSSGSPAVKHGVEITVCADPTKRTQPLFHQKMARIPSREDAEKGVVWLDVDDVFSNYAGIWTGQSTIYQYGVSRRIFPFYYEVTPNIAIPLTPLQPNYPVTTVEVRMKMRDMCPEGNFLIDKQEITQAEIMWAILHCIDEWNAALPPVAQNMNALLFPFRHNLEQAAVGELMLMVARWMRRNDLDYAAAGLEVADTKKWPYYQQVGTDIKKEWSGFVKQKKIQINLEGAYGALGGWPSWWF